MPYTWTFNKAFASEFTNLPEADQDKVLDFLNLYEKNGLGDFEIFIGKISPPWSGNISQENYDYAFTNALWHYHVGIPTYEQRHKQYKTSEIANQ